MEMKPVIHLVATNCHPDDEVEFNKWYNETHIPLLLKFRGIKRVARYKLMKEAKEYPKYLAIYEFKSKKDFEEYTNSPELTAATQELKESWKEQEFEITWRVQYELMKIWGR